MKSLLLLLVCLLVVLVSLAPAGEAARQCAEGDETCSQGGSNAHGVSKGKKSRKKKKKKKNKKNKKKKKKKKINAETKKKTSKRSTIRLSGTSANDLIDEYGVAQLNNGNFDEIVGRNKFVFAMFTTQERFVEDSMRMYTLIASCIALLWMTHHAPYQELHQLQRRPSKFNPD